MQKDKKEYEHLFKRFKQIVEKYNLEAPDQAEKIAEYLTMDKVNKISAKQFSEEFGMDEKDAIDFLEWIRIGIEFRQKNTKTQSQK